MLLCLSIFCCQSGTQAFCYEEHYRCQSFTSLLSLIYCHCHNSETQFSLPSSVALFLLDWCQNVTNFFVYIIVLLGWCQNLSKFVHEERSCVICINYVFSHMYRTCWCFTDWLFSFYIYCNTHNLPRNSRIYLVIWTEVVCGQMEKCSCIIAVLWSSHKWCQIKLTVGMLLIRWQWWRRNDSGYIIFSWFSLCQMC